VDEMSRNERRDRVVREISEIKQRLEEYDEELENAAVLGCFPTLATSVTFVPPLFFHPLFPWVTVDVAVWISAGRVGVGPP
jgi:hypothetical protein